MSDLENISCSLPITNSGLIRLGHGSGGKMSSQLIETMFLPRLGKDIQEQLDDAALVPIGSNWIALSTDSYVVSPIFFPGGNIGSLAVNGTINDLAMRAAKPLYLAATFIMEEGLPFDELERVIDSFGKACADSGLQFVAADTKVVNKGACDKLFITTTGIGLVEVSTPPAAHLAKPGDCVIVSGDIGRHGMAVMACREGLNLETSIESDSAALHNDVQALLNIDTAGAIHCMRDITRGGLATVLSEIAVSSAVGIEIHENAIPIQSQVRAVCEILGLDPLYVACEGRFVFFAAKEASQELLACLQQQSHGNGATIIGEVTDSHEGRVIMHSRIGGKRIIDKLSGEQLPRIC